MFTDKWGLQKEPFILDSTDALVNYYNYMWEETYFGDYDIALKLSPNSPEYKNRSRYMNNTLRQMDEIRKNKLRVKNNEYGEIVDGVVYDVPILVQNRNECWFFSDISIYSWENDLQIGYIESKKMAEQLPADQSGNTGHDKGKQYKGETDYNTVKGYLLENGPMYIRFGGEKPHSAVLVGCFENSDGQTYAIYNNHDNEQTIVPYDDFINEVYKEDDGYLQTI